MDDKKRTYNGLAFEGVEIDDEDGVVIALFSRPEKHGDTLLPGTEKCLDELKENDLETLRNNVLPDDIAYRFIEQIELWETARKAVQEFKIASNYPIETSPVDLKKLPKLEDFNTAANETHHGTNLSRETAQIYEFPCLSNNT